MGQRATSRCTAGERVFLIEEHHNCIPEPLQPGPESVRQIPVHVDEEGLQWQAV